MLTAVLILGLFAAVLASAGLGYRLELVERMCYEAELSSIDSTICNILFADDSFEIMAGNSMQSAIELCSHG